MKVDRKIVITIIILIFLLVSLSEIGVTLNSFLSQNGKSSNYIYDEKIIDEKVIEDERQEMGNTQISFRGIDFYPEPYPYATSEAFDALEHLLSLQGINFVQLRFFLSQDSLTSNKVVYDEKQDIILESMIAMVHKAGKKVSLLPDVIIKTGDYIASLDPEDIEQWFASYSDALMHYAILAQAYDVELFCIGNEFHSLWIEDQKWGYIIDKLRRQYKGLITTKLNCWWQEKTFQKVLTYGWLEKLDYIAIAPYFDLTWENDLSLEAIKNSWQNSRHGLNIVKELEEIAKKYKKKMIFSEIGYRSIDGTTIEPWNSDSIVPRSGGSGKIDLEEQLLATQALLDVFKDKDWWAGVIWFYWPTVKPSEQDRSWAIWNKPVQLVIQNNFCDKGGD